MRKLAYVIIRENLYGPIIQSQVIDVISNIAQKDSKTITLLWLFRIDYLFRRAGSIQKMRKELRSKNIELIAVPFISFGFPVSWYILPVVLPQWIIGFLWVYFSKKTRVFHCRSYHAALTGACIKKFLPIQFIFDPRSPFPEENVAAKCWKEKSTNFRAWKAIERWLCNSADVTIAISDAFSRSLLLCAPESNVVVIPNNYPRAFDRHQDSFDDIRSDTDVIRLCYVGSFGNWNAAELYLELVSYLMGMDKKRIEAKFVIQSEALRSFKKISMAYNLDVSKIAILSTSQEDVFTHMAGCDFGLQLMSRPDDRLSIKTVEYLSAGLPIIISENVSGAAELVRKHNLGFILRSDLTNKHELLDFMYGVMEDRLEWRLRCRGIASRKFSSDVIAGKLQQIYQSI